MQVIDEHIAGFRSSALGEFLDRMPWELTQDSIGIVERLLGGLRDGYAVSGGVATHLTSTVGRSCSAVTIVRSIEGWWIDTRGGWPSAPCSNLNTSIVRPRCVT